MDNVAFVIDFPPFRDMNNIIILATEWLMTSSAKALFSESSDKPDKSSSGIIGSLSGNFHERTDAFVTGNHWAMTHLGNTHVFSESSLSVIRNRRKLERKISFSGNCGTSERVRCRPISANAFLFFAHLNDECFIFFVADLFARCLVGISCYSLHVRFDSRWCCWSRVLCNWDVRISICLEWSSSDECFAGCMWVFRKKYIRSLHHIWNRKYAYFSVIHTTFIIYFLYFMHQNFNRNIMRNVLNFINMWTFQTGNFSVNFQKIKISISYLISCRKILYINHNYFPY